MKNTHRGYTLFELIIGIFFGAWIFIGVPTMIYVAYHFIAKYW